MATPGVKIMTSDDIFIEINGVRVAGVESVSEKYTSDTKTVDAFGQLPPIGFTVGSKKYTIDLSRTYLEDTAITDGINFYNLSDFGFNLVIIKNGKRVVYKSCIISDISNDSALKDKATDKITVMALDRAEE